MRKDILYMQLLNTEETRWLNISESRPLSSTNNRTGGSRRAAERLCEGMVPSDIHQQYIQLANAFIQKTGT